MRFSKNLETYHNNAKVQKCMAEKLASFSERNDYKNVLELGCGTGFLTKFVNEKVQFQKYVAIDIVEECSKYISLINSRIEFKQDDIEHFLNFDENKYDLIISNASLQWVEDFQSTVELLYSKLNPKGELIVSTFGKENFREIYNILGKGLNYYSLKDCYNMFETLNITKVEEEIYIMAFDSPKDVLRHLQVTGVNAIESIQWTKGDLISFENAYSNICSKRPTLTYNPLYIHFKSL